MYVAKKDLNRRKTLGNLGLNLIRPFIELIGQIIVKTNVRRISTAIPVSILKVKMELPKKEEQQQNMQRKF